MGARIPAILFKLALMTIHLHQTGQDQTIFTHQEADKPYIVVKLLISKSSQFNLQMPNRLIDPRFHEDRFPKTRIEKVKIQQEVKLDGVTNTRDKSCARQKWIETNGTVQIKEEETREENDLTN